MASITNYFQLFDLEPAFELDVQQLLPRFRELQRQFHPDRVAAEPLDVQHEAVRHAADINAAFSALKDPVLRARHLLALAGHALDSESVTVADADFLMAQMELREQLEEAVNAAQCAGLREEARDWLASLGREFAIDYREGDWREATDTLRKMQFMARFIEDIGHREARLEDAEDDDGMDD
ncbi:MAG: Fe-S protein assembly co-chaperone HscB [Moraxellaceae bacterium]|nr:Fe-S protein assembly co-chaperone HscB [Moraxellaceae bacterium]